VTAILRGILATVSALIFAIGVGYLAAEWLAGGL
jgi:hypothetical protein